MLLQHRLLHDTSICSSSRCTSSSSSRQCSSRTWCSNSSNMQCIWHQVLDPLAAARQAACLATCLAVRLQALVLPLVVCRAQLACTQQLQQQQEELHLQQLLRRLVASWWCRSSSRARAGRAAQQLYVAASRSTASAGARWTTCWCPGVSVCTALLRAALAACRSLWLQREKGWRLWWVWHLRGLCVQHRQLLHQQLVVACGLALGAWQEQGLLEVYRQQQQQQQAYRLVCGQVCQVCSQVCRVSSSSSSSRQVFLLVRTRSSCSCSS
jgi:hypothetical protein